jgi:hypothetical protein
VYGPGVAAFTKSPDGTEDWFLYNVSARGGTTWIRNICGQKFEWVNDEPVLGEPVGLNTLVPIPSGEVVDRIMIQGEDMDLTGNTAITEIEGDKVLVFPALTDTASALVKVTEKGQYPLYLRYRNNTDTPSPNLYIRLNNTTLYSAIAFRSDKYCSMTAVGLPLEAGENLLTFTADNNIKLDLIVLDRIKVE